MTHPAASVGALGGRQAEPALRLNSRRPPAVAAAARRPRARRTAALRVAAFAQSAGSCWRGAEAGAAGEVYERVLRYPDGKERRIRYPAPPAQDPRFEDLTDGCWADTCWEPRAAWCGLWAPPSNAGSNATSPPAPTGSAATTPAAFAPDKPKEAERPRMPSSPMELLRYLNSPEHQAAQREQWARVRGSYEVLDQVPWVAPKPLYLLAVEQPPSASRRRSSRAADEPQAGLSYSLRTRVAQADAEDELSRVLRRRAPDGGPLIRCSEIKDGVVAFEEEADAERYGQMLEAEGAAEVSIARCDSHELFRSVQDVRAVVVLLRRNGAFLPQPHQLATSLRSQAEEGGEPGSDGQPMFD